MATPTPARRRPGFPRRQFFRYAAAAVAAAGIVAFDVQERRPQPQLHLGSTGPDVHGLQEKIAGWVCRQNEPEQVILIPNGVFDTLTERALGNFQAAYGLSQTRVTDQATWYCLDGLDKSDLSTTHFDWAEFYPSPALGFAGGAAPEDEVRRRTRRMMLLLEALRRKLGDRPIYLANAFRPDSMADSDSHPRWQMHGLGLAVDVAPFGHKRTNLYQQAGTCGFSGLGRVDAHDQHCDFAMAYPSLPGAGSWSWASNFQ